MTDDDLSNPDLIFGASVSGGIIIEHLPGQSVSFPDFVISMTDSLYLSAIMDPFVLLNSGLLGSKVFINDFGAGFDQQVLFAGVRRNLFRVQQVSEPATLALMLAFTLVFGLRIDARNVRIAG